jgi:hypothetical protein
VDSRFRGNDKDSRNDKGSSGKRAGKTKGAGMTIRDCIFGNPTQAKKTETFWNRFFNDDKIDY